MSTATEKIKESSRIIRDIVWPKVGADLGGGRLVPVEGVSSHAFAKDLDCMSGIDQWQVLDNSQRMRGLAVRIQQPKKLRYFKTFTIRYRMRSGRDTEIHKRLAALKDADGGWLNPAGFIQAYVKGEHVTAVAAVGLRPLIETVAEGEIGKDFTLETTSAKYGETDETTFAVVSIDTLKKRGAKVYWRTFNDDIKDEFP